MGRKSRLKKERRAEKAMIDGLFAVDGVKEAYQQELKTLIQAAIDNGATELSDEAINAAIARVMEKVEA